jgi:hypothetical protein
VPPLEGSVVELVTAVLYCFCKIRCVYISDWRPRAVGRTIVSVLARSVCASNCFSRVQNFLPTFCLFSLSFRTRSTIGFGSAGSPAFQLISTFQCLVIGICVDGIVFLA